MGMLVTPVIYPLSYVPSRYRPFMALNSMTGMVLGFRYALLGTELDWRLVAISLIGSGVILVISLLIFRRRKPSLRTSFSHGNHFDQ